MKVNSYKYLKLKFPDHVILILMGGFYNAFENSAYVLNKCFGYQVANSQYHMVQAGFPAYQLGNVLDKLEILSISYKVVDRFEIVSEKSFCNNKFDAVVKYSSNIAPKSQHKKPVNKKSVAIGDIVTFVYEDSGETEQYEIVGLKKRIVYRGCGGSYYGATTDFVLDEDISVNENKLSDTSPLGKALLDSSVGEIVSIHLPHNEIKKVKIVSIKKQKKV